MICSLIGAFLLVYVATITFMNILGYPLTDFILVNTRSSLSLKKRYCIRFVLQILAMFTLLQVGHITKLPIPYDVMFYICFLFAIVLSILTFYYYQALSLHKKIFISPLLTIISICFWLTLFHA